MLENVFRRNVRVGRVAEAVLTIDLLHDTCDRGPHRPVVRKVVLENVTSTASPRVMWIVGFPGLTIEGVRFRNCTFRGLEAPEVMNHAAAVSFENVTVESLKRGRSINSPQAAPPK